MKRRVQAAVVLLLCVGILAAVAVWKYPAPRAPGVSFATFRRLHVGMTEEQVEAILGRPREEDPPPTGSMRSYWYDGDECTIDILFREEGAMAGGARSDDTTVWLRERPPTLLEMVRDWLGM